MKASIVAACLIGVAAGCIGCGDDDGPGPASDAGADSGAPDAGPGVAPAAAPAEPAPPVLTPCPAGWRELAGADGAPATCDAWPTTGRATCAAGEAHFVGTPGCAPVGPACPADPASWAADLPTDRRVLYVRAGAPAGGDGSRTSPFATIADATSVAAATDAIALTAGTYDESVVLRNGVALIGACAGGARIAPSAPDATAAAVSMSGTAPELRNVTVAGMRRGVVVTGVSTHAVVENVIVEGTHTGGLAAADATVVARSLVVRDTRPSPSAGLSGGIDATRAAHVEVVGGVVERASGFGALATAATIVLDGVLVTETQLDTTSFARAVVVIRGGRIEVRRSVLERSDDLNAAAEGARSTLVVEDSVVRAQAGDGARRPGGVAIQMGATGEVRRVRFEGLYNSALQVGASQAVAEDVVVHALQIYTGRASVAFVVRPGSTFSLTRAYAQDVWSQGALVEGAGATATFTDVDLGGLHGPALVASDGSHADLVRFRARDSELAAIMIGRFRTPDGASATMQDVILRDARPLTDGPDVGQFGEGISAVDATAIELERVLVERPGGGGMLFAGPTTSVTARDVTVRDCAGQDDGLYGRGITTQRGAQLVLERARVERARETGLDAYDTGTLVSATDLTVVDTLPRVCATTTCAASPGAMGVCASIGAAIDVRRFEITSNALAGVQVSRDGALDLHDGVVSRNPIGANVQIAGYDVMRLSDQVRYDANESNLDARELPVPDPALSRDTVP